MRNTLFILAILLPACSTHIFEGGPAITQSGPTCRLTAVSIANSDQVFKLEYSAGVVSAITQDSQEIALGKPGPASTHFSRSDETGDEELVVTVANAAGATGSCSLNYIVPDTEPKPTLTLTRTSDYHGSDLPGAAQPTLGFALAIQGTVSEIAINNAAVPVPDDLSAPLAFQAPQSPDRTYRVNAVVRGPGGETTLTREVPAPFCSLSVSNITTTSARVRITFSAGVESASIDNTSLNLVAGASYAETDYGYPAGSAIQKPVGIVRDGQDDYECHLSFAPVPPATPVPPSCSLTRIQRYQPGTMALEYRVTAVGDVQPANSLGATPYPGSSSVYKLIVPITSSGSFVVPAIHLSGSGGTADCPAEQFDPPACGLDVVANTLNDESVKLRLVPGPGIQSALVDGTIKVGPGGIPLQPLTFVPKNFTVAQKGTLVQSVANVYNAVGDQGQCKTSYTVPRASVVNVVVSYISHAQSTFSMLPDLINIDVPFAVAEYGNPENLQILVRRSDGTEQILSGARQLFQTKQGDPQAAKGLNLAAAALAANGMLSTPSFQELFVRNPCRLKSLLTRTVGGTVFAAMPFNGANNVDPLVNRGNFTSFEDTATSFKFSITDNQKKMSESSQSYASGYYQVAFCIDAQNTNRICRNYPVNPATGCY